MCGFIMGFGLGIGPTDGNFVLVRELLEPATVYCTGWAVCLFCWHGNVIVQSSDSLVFKHRLSYLRDLYGTPPTMMFRFVCGLLLSTTGSTMMDKNMAWESTGGQACHLARRRSDLHLHPHTHLPTHTDIV